ncbi:hypothetical protein RB595_002005 [Gaeumannomyces hyphopodioides]
MADKELIEFHDRVWPNWIHGTSPAHHPDVLAVWFEACKDVRAFICGGKNPLLYMREIPNPALDCPRRAQPAELGQNWTFAYMVLTHIYFDERLAQRAGAPRPRPMTVRQAGRRMRFIENQLLMLRSRSSTSQVKAAQDAVGPLLKHLVAVEHNIYPTVLLPGGEADSLGRVSLAVYAQVLAGTVACSRVLRPSRQHLSLLDQIGRAYTGFREDQAQARGGLQTYQIVRWLHHCHWHRDHANELSGRHSGYRGVLMDMIAQRGSPEGQYRLMEKLASDLWTIGAVAGAERMSGRVLAAIWATSSRHGVSLEYIAAHEPRPGPRQGPETEQRPLKRFFLRRRLPKAMFSTQAKSHLTPSTKRPTWDTRRARKRGSYRVRIEGMESIMEYMEDEVDKPDDAPRTQLARLRRALAARSSAFISGLVDVSVAASATLASLARKS